MTEQTTYDRLQEMQLSPHETDKLMVSLAAMVARDRLARGVKLNYPEAVAIMSSYVLEGARDARSVGDLMASGRATCCHVSS